jgi:hypothetical protein
MPTAGVESVILANEWSQTHFFECEAIGIGFCKLHCYISVDALGAFGFSMLKLKAGHVLLKYVHLNSS